MLNFWDVDGVKVIWMNNVKERLKEERGKGKKEGVVYYGSYCSYDKVKVGGKVLFWDLYKGSRFELFKMRVEDIKRERVFIFSGLYGLVLCNEYGMWYDKFMDRYELNKMKDVVKKRLSEFKDEKGLVKVVYYIEERIIKSWWYVEVIKRGCEELGIEIEIRDVLFDKVVDWEEMLEGKNLFVGF